MYHLSYYVELQGDIKAMIVMDANWIGLVLGPNHDAVCLNSEPQSNYSKNKKNKKTNTNDLVWLVFGFVGPPLRDYCKLPSPSIFENYVATQKPLQGTIDK